MPTLLRHLAHLTWLETKIFVREPLGVIGSVAVPVLLFVVVGRIAAGGVDAPDAVQGGGAPGNTDFLRTDLPLFAAILITLSAALSLITIIAIYREGGILRRLRATPIRPPTILVAHVLVKLAFTAATLALLVLAGRRFFPVGVDAPLVSFTLALVLATWSLLSIGFVIASVVPTARFAQPLGALLLYPMIPLSGLFAPIDALPPGAGIARAPAAADLRRVAAARHLDGRDVVGSRGRRRRARRRLRRGHRRDLARVPLGVTGGTTAPHILCA